jgi:hypothetical protein
LAGDISIANMNGGNGQCAKVIDAPSPQHAMKISGAKVAGNILSFLGSEKAQFEMSLSGGQTARLKFLNTPGEPWQLVKSADPSHGKQTHNQTTTPASLTEGGHFLLYGKRTGRRLTLLGGLVRSRSNHEAGLT